MPDRFAAVRRLFEQAAAAELQARRALLESARQEDAELADEVEGMLRHHTRADGILDRAPVELAGLGSIHAGARAVPSSGGSDRAEPEQEHVGGTLPPGTHVGRYTISGVIGVGGMGVVYEAEQLSPRRAVALKLVRSELVTRSMARRFEQEAAALALLQHPGIAQVYEAGAADLGGSQRPFMAMELIRGPTLAEFARSIPLSTRQKLSLVALICDAVQHAHQRGVIHRDLKPGNVLVMLDEPEAAAAAHAARPGRPAVPPIKILDFGVSRLIERESGAGSSAGAAASLATRIGQVVGTLGYMSPEQAAGDPAKIDSRTDIYSVGVILYELLVGRRPIAVESSTVAEALRAAEQAVVQPPSRFDRSLRGDIDTIVMRALAREPGRRYASASELAADIRSHLADEPISARPYSTREVLARAWRQRRPWFVGGIAVFATLLGGFASTLWQSQRAVRESERAQRQAAIAHQANRFLSTMLEAATPAEARGREVTVREMVDAAARDVGDGSHMEPELAGSILQTLGETYDALGIAERAEDCLRRAVDLYTSALGGDAPPTLECRAALSEAIADGGRGEEAAAMSAQTLTDARRVLSVDHPLFIDLLTSRNYTLSGEAARAEQERVMSECVERCIRLYGPDHRRTLQARAERAIIHIDLGRAEQGLAEMADIRERAERVLGPDHPSSIAYLENHAAALQRLDRVAEAEPLIRRALELSQRVNGSTHPSTLLALRNLTVAVMMQGRFAEAEPIANRLLNGRVERFGAAHPLAIEARGIYASTLIMQRKVEAARPVVEEVHRLSRDAFGDTDERTIQAITLRYDLAEAADDPVEMARWAEKLKGTPFDPAKAKQTEIPR